MPRLSMFHPTQTAGIVLPENGFFRLRGSRGARIVCLGGNVLITASGHYQDIDLGAGDGFVIPNNGLVLVEAIGNATISVEARSRARSPWQRVLRAARQACTRLGRLQPGRQPDAARTAP